MFSLINLGNSLRAVASGLQIPVMVVLLLLIALTVFMAGTLIAEVLTERLRFKAKVPSLMEKLKDRQEPAEEIIQKSGLLKRQKNLFLEILSHNTLAAEMREALARRLIFEEQSHYDVITRITDLIARLAPMFGLMGTLIPLGPGIIALGQGDTYTLSKSMLMAFDTTVAGLISAAAAFLISAVRKSMYENYMVAIEAIMESILEVMDHDETTIRQVKNRQAQNEKAGGFFQPDGRHGKSGRCDAGAGMRTAAVSDYSLECRCRANGEIDRPERKDETD
jgi:biopolymer transport protein ExbB/TolQ